MQNTQQLALHIEHPEDIPETDEDKNALESPVSIPSREFRVAQEIQHGTFGMVKMGFWNKKPVAIKIQKDGLLARNEAKLHHKLSHPNIVLLLAVSQNPDQYWMILEKMDGDLLDYINAHTRISFAEKLDFATQITTGVEYLHNVAKVLHRDLKSENVLISNGNLKIADFGLSTPISETKQSPGRGYILGPWQGYAPELINKRAPFTLKTDIYSLGILLNEILTRSDPYPDVNSRSSTAVARKLLNIAEGTRPTVDHENVMTPIVEKCWAQNPENRPLISNLLSLLLRVSAEPVPLETAKEAKQASSPVKPLKLIKNQAENTSPNSPKFR